MSVTLTIHSHTIHNDATDNDTSNLVKCDHCGQLVDLDETTVNDVDGETWCEECCERDAHWCEHCCNYTSWDTYTVGVGYRWGRGFSHEEWCRDCVDSDAVECSDCGELFSASSDAIDQYDTWDGDSVDLCVECRDENWRECYHCGNIVPYNDTYYDDNDDACCPDCYESHRRSDNLESYSHTIGEWFWQDDGTKVLEWERSKEQRRRLYLGIELETSDNDNPSDLADDLIDEFTHDRLCCKQDCSIGSDGVEIVSQPMTPLCHLSHGMWETVADIVRRHGGVSHDGGRCGLHIHISRDFFRDHDAVYRLDRLFTRFRPQLVNFSRRGSYEVQRWCGIDTEDELAKVDDVEKRKAEWYRKKGYAGRYQAVNDTCYNTVEIRLWRGTLNQQTFRATVELTAGLAIICNTMGDKLADQLTWSMVKTLVRYALEASGIPHDDLDAYLKERGL